MRNGDCFEMCEPFKRSVSPIQRRKAKPYNCKLTDTVKRNVMKSIVIPVCVCVGKKKLKQVKWVTADAVSRPGTLLSSAWTFPELGNNVANCRKKSFLDAHTPERIEALIS